MYKQLRETTEAIQTKEAAHDRAEAWAEQITREVAAHQGAAQRVKQAELAHSTQPSTQTATRVNVERQHLSHLKGNFEQVGAT